MTRPVDPKGPDLTRLLDAARAYRLEVPLPARAHKEELEAAAELDAALEAFLDYCPTHGGYDRDQRGPGWCPYCVAERNPGRF